MKKLMLFGSVVICLVATASASNSAGVQTGNPTFKSIGPIAFGENGLLFIADTKSAAITAIETEDTQKNSRPRSLKVEGINEKIAALLGASPDQIIIDDLAVNPDSGNVYLAVSRGRGPDAIPVLIRVKGDGQPELFSTEDIRYSRAVLPDAPIDGVVQKGNRKSNPRQESITDIAFFQDRVLVAGLSNEEFASMFRAIPYPFKNVENGTSVEIYHGAHGRFETLSPIRTFVPFNIGNEPHLLAAYTCTPLVQFPVNEMKPGAKIKGKTVAELGNRNRPLDMIVYQKDGKDFLLLANSSRGIMKIPADQIAGAEDITEHVKDGTSGVGYETIEAWKGIDQLDRYDADHALVLRRSDGGSLSLESLDLP